MSAPIRPPSRTPHCCATRTGSSSARTFRWSPMTTTRSAAGRGSARSGTTSAARSSVTTRARSSRPAELTLARLTPGAVGLLRAARAAAPDAALAVVGGTVRDALLGRPDADVDLAVPRGALEVGERIAARLDATLVVLDAERGAVRVAAPGLQLDISDFRAATLAEDLAARDFTVNALAVDLERLLTAGRAPIVDPTGGLADLRTRRLRPAGRTVLADDPLRVLRGVRLEATLAMRPPPATLRAMRAAASGLARVAGERVRDELVALLRLPATGHAVRRLDGVGALAVILPEVQPMRAAAQPAPHRFNVLEHSLRALESCDRVLARLD